MADFFRPISPRKAGSPMQRGVQKVPPTAPSAAVNYDGNADEIAGQAFAQQGKAQATATAEAEKAAKQAQQAAQDAINFETDLRAKRENRETITDPTGHRQFTESDTEVAAKQAEKAAEEERAVRMGKQNDRRVQAYKSQNREYFTDSTGRVRPVEDNDTFAAAQAEKTKKASREAAQAAQKTDLATAEQLYTLERDDHPVLLKDDREKLIGESANLIEDAVYQAIRAKGLSPQKKAQLEAITTRAMNAGERLTLDDVPADLRETVSQTAPETWTAALERSQSITADDQNRLWRTERERAIEEQRLRTINPAAADARAGKTGSLPQDLTGTNKETPATPAGKAPASPPLSAAGTPPPDAATLRKGYETRATSFGERSRQFGAQQDQVRRQWEGLMSESEALSAQGGTADDFVTVQIGDQERLIHKALVPRLEGLSRKTQAMGAKWDEQASELEKERVSLNQEFDAVRQADAVEERKKRAEFDGWLSRLEQEPDLAPVAAHFREAEAGIEARRADIEEDLTLTPKERLVATLALQEDRKAAYEAGNAALAEANTSRRKRYDGLQRLTALADGAESYAAGLYSYDKTTGTTTANNPERARAIAARQHAAIREIAAASGITPTEAARTVRDYQDARVSWAPGENTRLLSDGKIVPNPALAFDNDRYVAAVEASGATPEAKSAALEAQADLQRALASPIAAGLRKLASFRAWEEAQADLPPDRRPRTQGELVARYMGQRGKGRSFADNAELIVRQGGNDIAAQFFGFGAALGQSALAPDSWRDRTKAVLEDLGDQTGGAITGSSYEMGAALNAAGVPSFVQELGRASISTAPALLSGGIGFAGKAGTAALLVRGSQMGKVGRVLLGAMKSAPGGMTMREITPKMAVSMARQAGLGGAGAGAFMQTFGSTYPEAIRAYQGEGMTFDDAADAALLPSVASGTFTAAVTMAFGKTGVEQILGGRAVGEVTARELVELIAANGGAKQWTKTVRSPQFREMSEKIFLGISADIRKETVEEGSDSLVSDLIRLGTYEDNPDATVFSILGNTFTSAAIGGTLGAGGGAVKQAASLLPRRKGEVIKTLEGVTIEGPFIPAEESSVIKTLEGVTIEGPFIPAEESSAVRKEEVSATAATAGPAPADPAGPAAAPVVPTTPAPTPATPADPTEPLPTNKRPERLALSDTEIEAAQTAKDPDYRRASAMRKIANGETESLSATELLEIGIERDKAGALGPRTLSKLERDAGPVAPMAAMEGGDVVLTAEGLDWLESKFPRTRALVAMDEPQARQYFRERAAAAAEGAAPAQEAETGDPLAAAPDPVTDELTAAGFPPDQPIVGPISRPAPDDMAAEDARVIELADYLVAEYGVDVSQARAKAGKHVRQNGVTQKDWAVQALQFEGELFTSGFLKKGQRPASSKPPVPEETAQAPAAAQQPAPIVPEAPATPAPDPVIEQEAATDQTPEQEPPAPAPAETPAAQADPPAQQPAPKPTPARRGIVDAAAARQLAEFGGLSDARVIVHETSPAGFEGQPFWAIPDKGEVHVNLTALDPFASLSNPPAAIEAAIEEEFWHIATLRALVAKFGSRADADLHLAKIWREFSNRYSEAAADFEIAYTGTPGGFGEDTARAGWELSRAVMQLRHRGRTTEETYHPKDKAAIASLRKHFAQREGFPMLRSLRALMEAIVSWVTAQPNITQALEALADAAAALAKSPAVIVNRSMGPEKGQTWENAVTGKQFTIVGEDGGSILGVLAGAKAGARPVSMGPVKQFTKIYRILATVGKAKAKPRSKDHDRNYTPMLNFLRGNPIMPFNHLRAAQLRAKRKAMPLTEAERQWYDNNVGNGAYDGIPVAAHLESVVRPFLSGIWSHQTDEKPDQVAGSAVRAGVVGFPEGSTPSDMWEMVGAEIRLLAAKESKRPKSANKWQSREVEAKYDSGQQGVGWWDWLVGSLIEPDFANHAFEMLDPETDLPTGKTRAGKAITGLQRRTGAQLAIGDNVTVDGDVLTVTTIDDVGVRTLSSGQTPSRFYEDVITIELGQSVYFQKHVDEAGRTVDPATRTATDPDAQQMPDYENMVDPGPVYASTPMPTAPLTERAVYEYRLSTAKAEILADVTAGVVSREAQEFSDLHDYVDANEYINDSERSDKVTGPLGKFLGWKQADYVEFSGRLIGGISEWMAQGGHRDTGRPVYASTPDGHFEAEQYELEGIEPAAASPAAQREAERQRMLIRARQSKRLVADDLVTQEDAFIDTTEEAGGQGLLFAAKPGIQTADGRTLEGPREFTLFAPIPNAYHGTPHKVDKFRTDKIGTGEGAQVYGYGLYMAGDRKVGVHYQKTLGGVKLLIDGEPHSYTNPRHTAGQALYYAGNDIEKAKDELKLRISRFNEQVKIHGHFDTENSDRAREALAILEKETPKVELVDLGYLYTVQIKPDDETFLDWDKLVTEQSTFVKSALKKAGLYAEFTPYGRPAEGQYIYHQEDTSPRAKSQNLLSAGIRGIRYLDGNSRRAGEGNYNYVIFDENDIEIVAENDQPVTLAQAQEMDGALFASTPRDPNQRALDFGTTGSYAGNPNQGTFDFTEQTPAPATAPDPVLAAPLDQAEVQDLFDVPEAPSTGDAREIDARRALRDFGEKIGGARKDTATSSTAPKRAAAATSGEPWRKGWVVTEIVAGADEGRWSFMKESAKSSFWGSFSRPEATFATEADAEAALPARIVTEKHSVSAQRDSAGTETPGKWAIYRKIGDRKRAPVKKDFDSNEAALVYMVTNAAEILNTKINHGEEILALRPDQGIRRTGTARRPAGRDADDRMFMDDFGFRGVEFGNSFTIEEGREVLNHAYDGLHDLADILKIPSKAISLNGELALAFGARGHGLSGARAHYEPGSVVINLTKMQGAGSLAHEWMHALDHYFSRQEGRANAQWKILEDGTRVMPPQSKDRTFVTSGDLLRGSKLRPEIRDAWKKIRETMFRRRERSAVDSDAASKWAEKQLGYMTRDLDRIRDIIEKPREYGTRKGAATPAQIARWDAAVSSLTDGSVGPVDWQRGRAESAAPEKMRYGRPTMTGYRWTNPAFETLSEVYKEVTNRAGFSGERTLLGPAVSYYQDYLRRNAKLEEAAQQGGTEVKVIPTRYFRESVEGDRGRASNYWQTPWEMAARAFSSYIEDAAAAQGNETGFLSTGSSEADNAFYRAFFGFAPYPEGAERAEINKALDDLFGQMQTRETDLGTALFASTPRDPNQRALDFGTAGSYAGNPDQMAFDFGAATPPATEAEGLRRAPDGGEDVFAWSAERAAAKPAAPEIELAAPQRSALYIKHQRAALATIMRLGRGERPPPSGRAPSGDPLVESQELESLRKGFEVGKGKVSNIIRELIDQPGTNWNILGAEVTGAEDWFLLNAVFRNPFYESLRVGVLDDEGRVIHAELLNIGTVNESIVDVARIIHAAIVAQAKGVKKPRVLISHNHPSGDVDPSPQDVDVTRRVGDALKAIGAELMDHVITNGTKGYSFTQGGVIDLPATADVPWTLTERTDLLDVHSSETVHRIASGLRALNRDARYALVLNFRKRLVAVEQVSTDDETLIRQLAAMPGTYGATSVVLLEPGKPNIKKIKEIQDAARLTMLLVTDVANLQDASQETMREMGMLEPAGPEYRAGDSPDPASAAALFASTPRGRTRFDPSTIPPMPMLLPGSAWGRADTRLGLKERVAKGKVDKVALDKEWERIKDEEFAAEDQREKEIRKWLSGVPENQPISAPKGEGEEIWSGYNVVTKSVGDPARPWRATNWSRYPRPEWTPEEEAEYERLFEWTRSTSSKHPDFTKNWERLNDLGMRETLPGKWRWVPTGHQEHKTRYEALEEALRSSGGRKQPVIGALFASTPRSEANTERDAEYLNLAKDPEGNRDALQAMVDEKVAGSRYNRRGARFGFYLNGVPLEPGVGQNFGPGYYVAEGVSASQLTSGSVSVNPEPNKAGLERLGLTPKDVSYRAEEVVVDAMRPFTIDWVGSSSTRLTPAQKAWVDAEIISLGAVNNAIRKIQWLGNSDLARLLKITESDAAIGINNDLSRDYLAVIAKLIREGRLPFDSIRGIGGRSANGPMASELVVMRPSQIKSLAPVTYDESGNVIPLSQRFNPESDSVLFASTPQPLNSSPPSSRAPGETLFDGALNRVTAAIAATDTVQAFKAKLAEAYEAPFARPVHRFVDFLLKQAVPLQRLDAEVNAMMREMAVKQAFGQEEAMDVVRSVSNKAKFSDLGWPAQYANDKGMKKRLFLAMQGKLAMDTLPAEVQAIGTELRRRLNVTALEAVAQGRMHPDTFRDLRDTYMPHYYYDTEKAAAGSLFARMKLGLGDIMAQRSTMWRIEDMEARDPFTGEDGALVTWDDKGKKVRFRGEDHRNAFYRDFIRERAVDQIKTRGKVAAFSPATRAQIETLTPADLNRPDKLTDELRGYAKRVEQEMKFRYRKGDPLSDEDQEKIGLIQDPVYAVAKQLASMAHDNATAEFFNGLAAVPGIVGQPDTAGYVELPNNRKLGRLAGKWVKKDVAEEVTQLVNAPSDLAQFYDGVMALWKTGKTVYNPGTHVRNVLGNVLFAQMAGVNPLDPRSRIHYATAWTAIRKGGPLLEEMYKEGVLGGDFLTAELRQDLAEMLPALDIETGDDWLMKVSAGVDNIMHRTGVKQAKRKIEGAYQMEDELFKAASYLRAKSAGMTNAEAATHTRKWFAYYDQIGTSSTIRVLRRTAMPFFSFQREAIRILGNAARERPASLAFAMAAPVILSALSAAALGLDDEDYEKIRKTAMKGKGKFFARDYPLFAILLPTRSNEGRLQQLDLTNVMPFASLLGSRMEIDRGTPPWQQLALELITGSPITGIPLEMAFNKDTFLNKPIWEENMTRGEQAGAALSHVWRDAVPPLAPGGSGWNMAAQAGDRYSNKSLERRNAAQSYLRALAGIDVRNASPNLYAMADQFRTDRNLPSPDYGNSSTTPDSRARARIWAQLVQDAPNERAIAKELAFLRSRGRPIENDRDLNRLLFFKNPIMVIDGDDNQRAFRRSLSPESAQVLRDAEEEFARIQRQSGGILRQAQALSKTITIPTPRAAL